MKKSKNDKIQELTLEDVMGDRLDAILIYYSRASTSDVRDGLKPVQRRILCYESRWKYL